MKAAQPSSTRLVAHSFDEDEKSAAFADAARFVLDQRGPSDELRIVSPYLSAPVLAKLVAGHPFRLVTDLDECFNGRADAPLERFLAAHHERVRHQPGVHAKLLASSGALMLGSANLTRRGFAERDELSIVTSDPTLLDDARAWFEQLWNHSAPVDPAALERARSAAERAPKPAPAPAHTPSTSKPPRGLGWLAPPKLPPEDTFDAEPIDAAVDELAATLRKLVDNPSDARLVLGLFREALLATGLRLDDKQLHMGFGLKERRLHITVANRYVIWAFAGRRPETVPRAQPALGFIAADVAAIDDVLRRAPTRSWDGWFERPRVRTVKLCVSAIRDWIDVVRPVWLDAIAREVDEVTRGTRARTSSFLRARRDSLDTILRDQRLIDSTVERAFAPSTPTRSSDARSPRAANLTPSPEQPHAAVPDAEVDALAATLLRWVRDSTDARFVLELFREALLETGLTLDDRRLNASFSLSPPRIHWTVGNRYVLWGFPSPRSVEHHDGPAIGFIVADVDVVENISAALPGAAWSGSYTRPDVPFVIVALSRLREVLPVLRPSWLAAVRSEVSRAGASPGRRALRPSFDAMLRDGALFERVIERTKR